MTFTEIIQKFLQDADVTPSSRDTYRRWLVPWHKYVVNENMDAFSTQPFHVSNYKMHLLKTHSEKTVNCYLTAIRMLFRYMEENNLIETNPAIKVKFVTIHNKYRKHPLTIQQYIDLVNSCDNTRIGHRNRVLIDLMVQTGMRAVEVSRLKWQHIKENSILVHGKGHTSADYEMALDVGMISLIKKQSFSSASEYVFTTIHGKPLTAKYISEVIRDQMIRAKIHSDKISCHSLRHTKAVLQMQANGNNIFATSKAMRHTNIKTTEIYLQSIMNAHTDLDTSAHDINKILTTALNESNNVKKQSIYSH